MLQRATSTQAATYLANKAKFNRLRRKSRLDFDTLYQLFSADLTSTEIAKRAALSRPRVNLIYKQYFSELFGMSDRERRERREDRLRQTKANNLARVIAADRVLTAVFKSAEKAKRRIEPIIYRRGLNLSRRYRHRAVLVDRKDIEPVHHVCNARQFYPGGIHYGVTTLYRNQLESSKWVIFFVDVRSYTRRIIRCRSAKLLKALFPHGGKRKSVLIPLDAKPNNPRYDFLADEENWT